MKNILISQFIILLIGTLFAWTNFAYELYNWLNLGKKIGCAVNVINPFFTPCFFGAIFFTLAFVLSTISLKKLDK